MEAVGLIPSHTGEPGGKRTGERMSHFIDPDGAFIQACKTLLQTRFGILWFDRYPTASGKNYSYAGSVTIKATPHRLINGVGVPAGASAGSELLSAVLPGAETDEDDEALLPQSPSTGTPQEISVPVFSDIPVDKGIDVEKPLETGPTSIRPGKSNRLKYACPRCKTNVWGKPALNVICGACKVPFVVAIAPQKN